MAGAGEKRRGGPARLAGLLLVLGLLALLVLGGCGEDEGDGASAELTPEQVRMNLIDAGYEVDEILTSGANQAVAQGGKLDADAYLSVDYTPEGERLYVSVYFFSTEEDAGILDAEFTAEDDGDGAHELRGTRVYNVAGTQEQLDGVVAAAEGD